MSKHEITVLRETMREASLHAYIVPTGDCHGSEYLSPHFQLLAHLSGFTGSAGTLVVTQSGAALFTDGRYFLQAEAQLQGTGIDLIRMIDPGAPDLCGYLFAALTPPAAIGADARMMDAATALRLHEKLSEKGFVFRPTGDIAAATWPDRPPLPNAPARLLREEYAGKSAAEKLAQLRAAMLQAGACAHVLTALDDIAWLYNLRGQDIPHNPLVLCYTIVEAQRAYLFIDTAKLTDEIKQALAALGLTLLPYEDIYARVSRYAGQKVLLDPARVNYALYLALREHAAAIIPASNPVTLQKAVKNERERINMRRAHVLDGVALTTFIYWLKTRVGRVPVSERLAAAKLWELRRCGGALSESFGTIAAYGPHAAIVHYAATEESDAALAPSGFLLLDSGGQYPLGTTDVTRTIALGPVTARERRHFTLVLMGMLRLSAAIFPKGVAGSMLDAIARAPLWSEGLDYNHGTGHGIGSYLCVHEPPIRVNYRMHNTAAIESGMVFSVEPGVYFEGQYGIRIENQVLVRPNAHEGFLEMETLTLAPIDQSAVEPDMMSDHDIALFNAYHERVYDALNRHLPADVRAFLFDATRPLVRGKRHPV
ncbi:MAG: aminopeptidase P family protein [Clostridiales bacterium]|jgi:Xaa-Pro aminopeptidase|nr:aminopeptidase P family protein [Clostridiales bacterium]